MNTFQGVIIRSTDYKERDKLLNLATPDGLKTILARGVRSPKAKLKGFVNPLTFGEFSVTEGKTGYILNSVEVFDSFYECWTDTDKNSAAVLCLEAFEKLFREDYETATELVVLLKALREINYGKTLPHFTALWYLLQLGKNLGADFSSVLQFDNRAAILMETLVNLDGDEIDGLEYDKNTVFTALRYVCLVFKEDYGVTFKVMEKLIKQSV